MLGLGFVVPTPLLLPSREVPFPTIGLPGLTQLLTGLVELGASYRSNFIRICQCRPSSSVSPFVYSIRVHSSWIQYITLVFSAWILRGVQLSWAKSGRMKDGSHDY